MDLVGERCYPKYFKYKKYSPKDLKKNPNLLKLDIELLLISLILKNLILN